MGVVGQFHRPDVKTEDVRVAYEAGETLNSIARRVGMSRQGVKRRLVSVGVRIRTEDMVRRGSDNPKWLERPTVNAGRLRAHRLFPEPEPCEECGTTWRPTRHHIDHDPTNNDPNNIAWLCAKCHTVYHRAYEKAMAA